jgi:hypothetical protein
MSFPDKVIKIGEHDVLVKCQKIKEDHCQRYSFRAELGDASHVHTMTVGPIDGEFTPPTLEQLQKDVDAAREEAARHAHARHIISQLEGQIE